MNKKQLLLLTIILALIKGLSLPVMAQNGGYAEYTIKLSEDYLHFDATLVFNESASLFSYKQSNKDRWLKIREEGIGSQLVFTDTAGYVVYSNFDEDAMLIRSFCEPSRPLLYKDKFSISWEIIEGEKMIKGMVCKKARTNFRGRSYIAWFAPSVPTIAGPWKFYGLPGLILHMEDHSKQVEISLKSFKTMNVEDIQNDFSGEWVSIKEYNERADQAWEKSWHENNARIAKLQAEFPDVTVTNNNAPKKRPATELEFD